MTVANKIQPHNFGRRKSIKEEVVDKDGSLHQYGSRCNWLKDDKFLRDLEGDSVDTEILDEELRSLQEDEPKTCRGKTEKYLESNPFNILLCVLVLIDAGVVIAEIILDLQAARVQFEAALYDLEQATTFLRDEFHEELRDYSGDDIHRILSILRRTYNDTEPHKRKRRHLGSHLDGHFEVSPLVASDSLNFIMQNSFVPSDLLHVTGDTLQHVTSDVINHVTSDVTDKLTPDDVTDSSNSYMQSDIMQDSLFFNKLLRAYRVNSDKGVYSIRDTQGDNTPQPVNRISNRAYHSDNPVDTSGVQGVQWVVRGSDNSLVKLLDHVIQGGSKQSHHIVIRSVQNSTEGGASDSDNTTSDTVTMATDAVVEEEEDDQSSKDGYGKGDSYKNQYGYKEAKRLLKIAHILHYISIAILGIFVLQLFGKVISMGKHFFKQKMEVIDGVIIVASFALDVVFLDGVGNMQSEQAAALLISFLLWRILRVVNGIMITTKKRQEFRIKLQKRARRRAKKKKVPTATLR